MYPKLGLGQIALMVGLFLVMIFLFRDALTRWVAEKPLGPSVVSAVAFLLIYKLLPHRSVRWRHAFSGAAVACLLFEGAKEGFAVYVANVPGYNVLYGPTSIIISPVPEPAQVLLACGGAAGVVTWWRRRRAARAAGAA